MTRIRAAVFDAYGTLLDVHSAVGRYQSAIGPEAAALSLTWRSKQLEYTWTRSLMGRHAPFDVATAEALDWAMARHGVQGATLRAELLAAYRALDPYPEVIGMLKQLKAKGLATAILSNGSPDMLAAGVASAGIGDWLDAVLSVEEVGIFKPDRRVYQLAVDRLRVPAEEISFQSSNRWDAAGAASFGFHTVWINRFDQPDEYAAAGPVTTIKDLSYLANLLDPPTWSATDD